MRGILAREDMVRRDFLSRSVANLCPDTRTAEGKYTKHDINGLVMVQS